MGHRGIIYFKLKVILFLKRKAFKNNITRKGTTVPLLKKVGDIFPVKLG